MRVLIVGQGIAGTALAWALMRRGVAIRIVDGSLPYPASAAAAGLINPVTGKFYVKTWGYDDFFPTARRFYAEMEENLGLRFWQDLRVLRLLDTPQAINDWAARSADPAYQTLLGILHDAGPWSALLRTTTWVGETRGAARVDFGTLLTAFRKYLSDRALLVEHALSPPEALQWAKDFDAVVFCEGWRGVLNPFFPGLPWQLTFGEALLIRIHHPEANLLCDVVKKNALFVPLGNGLVWVGATYRRWTPSDAVPTSLLSALEAEVREQLSAPFEVVGPACGIRPTVRDRRPLIGESPMLRGVFLFNGLGTKGALLAPYWAEHLTNHLLEGTPIAPEVSVGRRS